MSKPRFMPPVYFLSALLAMTLLNVFLPGIRFTTSWIRFAGIPLMLLGGLLTAAGSTHFDRLGTTVKPFQPSSVLATGGPYAFSRNPMYLGLVVLLIGVGVVFASLTPMLIIPLFIWVLTKNFIVHEERALEERFGAEYTEYRQRVRRWI